MKNKEELIEIQIGRLSRLIKAKKERLRELSFSILILEKRKEKMLEQCLKEEIKKARNFYESWKEFD